MGSQLGSEHFTRERALGGVVAFGGFVEGQEAAACAEGWGRPACVHIEVGPVEDLPAALGRGAA